MARTPAKHQAKPHPAWRKALLAAWDRLDRYRGMKGEILEGAELGKNTLSRMANDPDSVSMDSWEDLRLALVDAFKKDSRLKGEAVPDLPPPLVPIRSGAHHKIVELMGQLDERGTLDALREWITIGERMIAAGIFLEFKDAMLERVEQEEARAASDEKLRTMLRSDDGRASDRDAMTGHGVRRRTPS